MEKGTKVSNAKPFLKWAGGKSQLLERFVSYYPADLKNGTIINYFEPFVGGGAVFFDVAQRYKIQSAFLYDINPELILSYRVIQKDVLKLIEILADFKKRYENLNGDKQSKYYYQVRKEFNNKRCITLDKAYSEDWIIRAAQIIFMNKVCFNGLFRFNQKGEFNVPIGRYTNPKILDEQNLLRVSELLQIAEIKVADFTQVEIDIKKNSFVYFDPPYRPISKTSGFTSYSKHKFEDKEQIKLAGLFHHLHQSETKLMLSNSDPKNNNPEDNFFDDLYRKFYINRVPAKRMINSDASKRNAVNEIIITNYMNAGSCL